VTHSKMRILDDLPWPRRPKFAVQDLPASNVATTDVYDDAHKAGDTLRRYCPRQYLHSVSLVGGIAAGIAADSREQSEILPAAIPPSVRGNARGQKMSAAMPAACQFPRVLPRALHPQ
jgi:hypothetical protein